MDMNITEGNLSMGDYDGLPVRPSILVAASVCMSLSIIAGMPANVLIVYATWRDKSLRTAINALVVNLALSDVISCSVTCPILLILMDRREEVERPRQLCSFLDFLVLQGALVQLITTLFIGFERHQAIAKPFDKLSRLRRVKLGIVISWVVGVSAGILGSGLFQDGPVMILCVARVGNTTATSSLLHYPFGLYVLVPVGFSLTLAIVTVYVRIILLVRRHARTKKHKLLTNNKVTPQTEEIPQLNGLFTQEYDSLKQPMKTPPTGSEVEKRAVVSPEVTVDTPEGHSPAHLWAVVRNKFSVVGHSERMDPMLQRSRRASYTVPTRTCELPLRPDLLPRASLDYGKFAKMSVSNISDGWLNDSHTSVAPLSGKTQGQAGFLDVTVQSFGSYDGLGSERFLRGKTDTEPDQKCLGSSTSEIKNSETLPETEKDAIVHVCDMEGRIFQARTKRPDVVGDVCVMNPSNRERGKRQVEARATRRVSAVVVAFLICWLPYPIVICISTLTTTHRGGTEELALELYLFSLAVALVAPGLNPIIYTAVNKQFIREIKRICRACKKGCCAR